MVDWPTIVEQHGPSVWRTAYRLLSNREEANDCYQETFLAAFEYSRKRKITSWPGLLKRIATSRSLDRLRGRYRTQIQPLANGELVISNIDAPAERLQRKEWMDELRLAIAKLPERHGNVFWLSEVEGIKHAEIAEQLDATSQQVATWLHRAKQKLRIAVLESDIAGEVKQ